MLVPLTASTFPESRSFLLGKRHHREVIVSHEEKRQQNDKCDEMIIGDEGLSDTDTVTTESFEKKNKLNLATSTRNERLYKCSYPECDKTYKKPSKLKEHELVHTGQRPFSCPYYGCDKSYRRSSHLQVHAKTHSLDSNEAKAFACHHEGCHARFATKQHLTRHVTIHEQPLPYACSTNECTERFAKHAQLRKHIAAHQGKKPFPCEVEGCEASFMTGTKLRKHSKVHSDLLRYTCGQVGCNSSFSKWTLLLQHVRMDHSIQCTICHRTFKRRSYLARHMHTHLATDQRPTYTCSWEGCDYTFASEKSLNVHVKVKHEGLKLFPCDFDNCDAKFAYKHTLLRHHKIHNEEGREKPTPKKQSFTEAELLTGVYYAGEEHSRRRFPCAVEGCKFAFVRQWDMERHLKSLHKNYEWMEGGDEDGIWESNNNKQVADMAVDLTTKEFVDNYMNIETVVLAT